MSIYSKPSRLAVRFLTHLARQRGDALHSVREVSRATGISRPTSAKILQALAKEGILESRKGPGGGFRLVSKPEELSLARIVAAVQGKDFFSECVGGWKGCSSSNPCPLHESWSRVRGAMEEFLAKTTLGDILLDSEGVFLAKNRN